MRDRLREELDKAVENLGSLVSPKLAGKRDVERLEREAEKTEWFRKVQDALDRDWEEQQKRLREWEARRKRAEWKKNRDGSDDEGGRHRSRGGSGMAGPEAKK